MDIDPRLDALVAPLRSEVLSGASAVAGVGADVLRRAAIRAKAGSMEEFRWALGEVSAQVLSAQPSMAPLVTLVRDVLSAVESVDDLEAGRHAAARAAEAFRSGLAARAQAVALRGEPLLPATGKIAILSSSVTVRATLLAGGEPTRRHVVCFESRPMREGRAFSSELAKAGLRVTHAVDAASASLVPECGAVLLGADSIGDGGIVNKIGSASLVYAANRFDIPVIVVADETKFLPQGYLQRTDDERPAEEVWRAPAGVEVWNRYFEFIDPELVSHIVTENDVLSPGGVLALRSTLHLPDGLAHWATARARRASDT